MRQAVVIGGGVGGRVGAGSTMGGAAGGLVRAGCDSYRQKKAPIKGLRGWGCGYSMINADPNTSPMKNVEPIRASIIPISSSSRHPSSFICSALVDYKMLMFINPHNIAFMLFCHVI